MGSEATRCSDTPGLTGNNPDLYPTHVRNVAKRRQLQFFI